MRCRGSRGFPKGALGIAKFSDAALNASFTEAVQRDNKHVGNRTFVWVGKAMKSIAMVSRARVYEAIAFAVLESRQYPRRCSLGISNFQ